MYFDNEFGEAFNRTETGTEEGEKRERLTNTIMGGAVNAIGQYVLEPGEDMEIDIRELDFSNFNLQRNSDFQRYLNEVRGKETNRLIRIDTGYHTTGPAEYFIGEMKIVIEGELHSDQTGWRFDGTISGMPDEYDFNEGKRGALAEFSTSVGRALPEGNYTIHFINKQPIHDEGTW